jgi:hypothetical protein
MADIYFMYRMLQLDGSVLDCTLPLGRNSHDT